MSPSLTYAQREMFARWFGTACRARQAVFALCVSSGQAALPTNLRHDETRPTAVMGFVSASYRRAVRLRHLDAARSGQYNSPVIAHRANGFVSQRWALL